MKKVFMVCLALLLVIPFAFASGNAESESGSMLMGFTCMDQTNPFQIAMKDAIQTGVEAHGDSLIAIDSYASQLKQNDAIDDMITRGIKVLFLNPVDQDGVKPALLACQEAGVKVIVIDSGVADPELTETYVSSNNYQAGAINGQQMLAAFPDGAKVALIDNPLAESVVSRLAGLQDTLAGTNIEIIGISHYSTTDKILPTFEDFLQTYPDLDILWGLNDDVGLIAQGVVESAGLTDQIKVFTVDGSPSCKQSIAKGGVYATAAQSPTAIGEKAVELAYEVLAGNPVEKTYSIETVSITAENIADYDLTAWL